MQTTTFFKVGLLVIIIALTIMVVVNVGDRHDRTTSATTGPVPASGYLNTKDTQFVGYDWVKHFEINELAKTLYMEERSSEKLMREVASVIMNRVNRPRWPNTIEEVIFQPRQFSCWDEGRYRYIDTSEKKGWEWANKIALEMYNKTFVPTNDADHYWAPKKIKSAAHQWRSGLVHIGMYGDHQFAIHP